MQRIYAKTSYSNTLLRYEIVRVLDSNTLIDRELCQHDYTTNLDGPLHPGVYLVMWPKQKGNHTYDHRARYVGPFEVSHQVEPMLYRCVQAYLEERRSGGGSPQNGPLDSIH